MGTDEDARSVAAADIEGLVEPVSAERNLLDEIVAHKRQELERVREQVLLDRLRERLAQRTVFYDFESAVRRRESGGDVRFIAEVKGASPSKGVLAETFDPVAVARAYVEGGTDALSVLTDAKYFQGSLEHVVAIRAAGLEVPILRKDFTLDRYHVIEAAAAGADAVLLIVAILKKPSLRRILDEARAVQLSAVVEVASEAEVERAVEAGASIIQINNRDLRTFQVDLAVTERLRPRIPEGIIVIGASGVATRDDVLRLERAGVDAVLVGESLMTAADRAGKLRELRGGSTSTNQGTL